MRQEKKEIIDYLSGPRDYFEGARLYHKYGTNLRLKRLFFIEETESSQNILFDELRKIVGLTYEEFIKMPRRSSVSKNNNTEDTSNVEIVSTNEETLAKIRFREKYSFLNDSDCPDILKILVSDLFTTHKNYTDARDKLMEVSDSQIAEASELCRIIVEEYLKNREIFDELDYYNKSKKILGVYYKTKNQVQLDAIKDLSDVELMSKLQSAQVQESKHKHKMMKKKDAGKTYDKELNAYNYWSDLKNQYKSEVESRKKK